MSGAAAAALAAVGKVSALCRRCSSPPLGIGQGVVHAELREREAYRVTAQATRYAKRKGRHQDAAQYVVQVLISAPSAPHLFLTIYLVESAEHA